jgi:hypothetical protein
MTHLASGESLSLDVMNRGVSTVFRYGLHNTVQIIERHTVLHSHPLPTNDEFMSMVEYFVELIHDLLASDSESVSSSVSSEGSHHPSWECFMAETSDEHVSSASDSGETRLKRFPCVRLQEGQGSHLR